MHQSEIVKNGFRSLDVGEKVEFELEKKSDGNVQAVMVRRPGSRARRVPKIGDTRYDPTRKFHPQQVKLDHHSILYRPEQL